MYISGFARSAEGNDRLGEGFEWLQMVIRGLELRVETEQSVDSGLDSARSCQLGRGARRPRRGVGRCEAPRRGIADCAGCSEVLGKLGLARKTFLSFHG